MIAPEVHTEEHHSRPLFGSSIVTLAGNYLKDIWVKRRCMECLVTGGRKCSKCDGQGLVVSEGSTLKELCRHCIGTGKEECPACERAEADASKL